MSSATEERTSVHVLEDAFRRRVQTRQDDVSAAVMAEELLEEVSFSSDKRRNGEAYYKMVAVGKKAMQVWAWLPENPSFPKTIDVLWSAVVDGWLADAIGQTMEEEFEFARFVSSAKTSNAKARELMLARVKEKLDELREDAALGKVTRFLTHIKREKAEDDMFGVIAPMLGRYADIDYQVFCAHILDTLRRNANNTQFFFTRHTLLLNAADVADVTAATLAVGHAARLIQQECFPSGPVLKITKSDKVSFTWENSQEIKASELEARLQNKVDKIQKWRRNHPTHPTFLIQLTICNPESNGKDQVTQTI